MPPRVSVVIASWNGRQLLADCLGALAAQTLSDFEVIVVDNGSTDGTVEWLAQHVPTVQVIPNATNRGFAAANNQAILAAAAPLIATLNNDALPNPDWLKMLVEAADQLSWAGSFASQIILREPGDQLDSTGIEVDRTGVAWNRGWRKPAPDRTVEPIEVFGPCAAAALYRRDLLDKIGLFDEALFAYYEDVDLAWRARWAGWRCAYIPQAVVVHAHSATGGQRSPFKGYYLGRNKWRVIAKNYPFDQLRRYIPLMVLLDLAAMIVALWRTRSFSPLQGRWAALREWRAILPSPHSPQAPDWRQWLVPVRLARYTSV